MKKHIFAIGKIILSVATLPLWFVKLFVGVGHLPNRAGEIVEVVFRHSMFENIGDLTHPILAYTAMAIAVLSSVMNVITLKSQQRAIEIAANMAFGVTMGLFLIHLLLASTVARSY